MTSRIINHHGNVEEVSDTSFFTRAFGHAPKTKAEREAEWNTEVERYVSLILSGCEMSSYGNPYVIEAKKRIALRDAEQLTETIGDPLPHLEPRRKVA